VVGPVVLSDTAHWYCVLYLELLGR
jgi:hypothetical protein